MKSKILLVGALGFATLFGCTNASNTEVKADERPKEYKVMAVASGYILCDNNGELKKMKLEESTKISGNILDSNEVTATIYDNKVSKIKGDSGEVIDNQIVGVGATGIYSGSISLMVTVNSELKSYVLEYVQLSSNINKIIGSKAQISSDDYVIKIY